MPFNNCEPCSCITANLDDRAFKQASLVVLCGILTSLGGGNDVYAYQTFCDPVTSEPVLVQTATNPTTGALTGLAGYFLDGTAYPDPVALLVACSGGGGGGGNVNLTGINGVTPSVGNGVSDTGTLRVAIASNNSPIAVTGTFFQATQPVSGTVTVTQATGTNLHTVVDSGVITTVGAVTAITNALPAGNNNIGDVDVASVAGNVTVVQPTGTNLHVVVDTLPAVSGSVTVVQPTGTNLHTVVDSGVITSVTAITNALPAGNNNIGDVDIVSGTITTVSAVTAITNALPAGTNALGSVTTTRTSLTAAAPTAASVGTSSAQAVASNGSRKGLILVNTSANTISLGFGANAAVLNSGITLIPGGTFSMEEYDFTTGAVNAIASVASSNLAIQEYT